MNTELHARVSRAIREYADAAPLPAGDVDAVLADPDRPLAAPPPVRHRRRWLVPAAAAAAVVAVVAVAATWLPNLTGTPPAGPQVPRVDIDLAAAAGSGSLDWLPKRIEARDDAPLLPRDRAVGAGAAVYRTKGGATVLVTSAGKSYRLDVDDRRPLSEVVSLSPDGRWLLTRRDELAVRDLTGTTEHQFAGRYGRAVWSPDSRWLAFLARSGPNAGDHPLQRLDLRTGAVDRLRLPVPGVPADPAAVLRSGDVVGLASFPIPDADGGQIGEDPRRFRLTFQGKRDGDRHTRDVHFSGVFTKLPPGDSEEVSPEQTLRLSPDGGTAAMIFYEWQGKRLSHLAGFVTFDIASGTPRARYNVVDPDVEDTTWDRRDEAANWRFLGQLDEGLLIAHHRDGGTELELVDPDTGERRVVSRLPAETPFLVRGS